MKKRVLLLICGFCFLVGCSDKSANNNRLDIDADEVKLGEIQNLKESSKEIPKFTISVMGELDTVITEMLIKDLQMYEFTLDVPTYDLDLNSDVYRDTFVGVKFSDVLEKLDVKVFDSIDFKGSGKLTVRYLFEEVDDNLYLVFYRNDTLLSSVEESPAMLVCPKLKTRYWVPSLIRVDIL